MGTSDRKDTADGRAVTSVSPDSSSSTMSHSQALPCLGTTDRANFMGARVMILYFRIAMGTLDTLLATAMLWVCWTTVRHGLKAEAGHGRRTAGNLLMAAAGTIMLASGTLKYLEVPHVVAEMNLLQLGGWKLQL